MESHELTEIEEKAHSAGNRVVGLTMAIVAALLAASTLMGHRLHTEEVILQTRAVDGWAYYQAKNSRFHMYAADAKLAQLLGPQGAGLAETWMKKAEEERQQAEDIRKTNERLDEETQAAARRATLFDASEICLEIAIVLCSIALLAGQMLFWRISFVGAALGLVMAVAGLLRH